jgi:3-methyl-2-oxobutanoate hydroxymethyltransferase
MLTCYDFQTAQLLEQTELDMILVGDSLGNVVLGLETTVQVGLDEMILFTKAVRRGAPTKFLVTDLPFGTYADFQSGLQNAIKLFQQTNAQAVKLEGAAKYQLELIERLTENGVPVMGHIGLRPQSVHQMGGYYTHGKNKAQAEQLLKEARALEKAGCFSVVLECIEPEISKQITQELKIPTIGIGSSDDTDGQVLVINDLLHLGVTDPPKFCRPLANLYEIKKELIEAYLNKQRRTESSQTQSLS